MKTFLIYQNNNIDNDKLIFVEEKFSWPAFIFSGLWLLYNRMWMFALICFLFNGFLAYLSSKNLIQMHVVNAVNIGIMLFLGLCGEDIKSYHLKKNNYQLVNIVIAKNKDQALLKHFKNINELNYESI